MRYQFLPVTFCIALSFLLGTVVGLQISQRTRDIVEPRIVLDAPRQYVPSIIFRERDGNTVIGEVHGTGAVRIFANDKQVLIDGSGAFRASLGSSDNVFNNVVIPANALFVASSRGKYYYPVTSSKGQGLSPKYRLYFQSAEAAERAGYKRGQ